MNKKFLKLFFLGILASLLSSLRLEYLPEVELILIVIILFSGNDFLIISSLIICLCSHHYAIPDVSFRFDSSVYPSIYTKKIGNFKIFDLLVFILSIFALIKFFRNTYAVRFNKNYPNILFLASLFLIVITPFDKQDVNLLFFNFRSLIIVFIFYTLLQNIENKRLIIICFLASYCWISKMLFSIMLPATNPLYREIFGLTWNIYFAGDEYLTLGVYFVSIILLYNAPLKSRQCYISRKINILIILALILALISQRKGSIIYFSTILMVINLYQNKTYSFLSKIFILFIPASTFIFLILILPFFPNEFNLLFFDQLGLLNSALDSIKNIFNTNFFNGLFGIGPFTYYEIKGLEDVFDNSMAFGSEVGNTFRYSIWSLPFGRLILNVGLIGFCINAFYYLKNFNKSALYFYLFSILSSFFYFENNTPINAISIAFILIVLKRINDNKPIRIGFNNTTV